MNPEELSNEQLVIRIKTGEDVAGNMEQLYNQVRRFIHVLAWKYRDSGELEDLEQEGYLALYPAIDGYDPAQGVRFLTYAEYHIRQRMRRYLQMNGSCLRLPVHCLEKVQRYKRLCNAFNREYGREPSDREAAAGSNQDALPGEHDHGSHRPGIRYIRGGSTADTGQGPAGVAKAPVQ